MVQQQTTGRYSLLSNLWEQISISERVIDSEELVGLVKSRVLFNLEVMKLWRESEYPPLDTWRSRKDQRLVPLWTMRQYHSFQLYKLCIDNRAILGDDVFKTYYSSVEMWKTFGNSPIVDYLVWTEKHVFMHCHDTMLCALPVHEYRTASAELDHLTQQWFDEVDALCNRDSDTESLSTYSELITRFEHEATITPAHERRREEFWDCKIEGEQTTQPPSSTSTARPRSHCTIQYSEGSRSVETSRIIDMNKKGLFPPCVSDIINKKEKGKVLKPEERHQLGTFLLSVKLSFETVLAYLLSGRQNEAPQIIMNHVNGFRETQCSGCDELCTERRTGALLVGCPFTCQGGNQEVHERILCQFQLVKVHGKDKIVRIHGKDKDKIIKYVQPLDGHLPTEWTLNLI